MRRQDWKDDHIEELLKQLPKISNHINKQEMYQQLMIYQEKKKRRRWLTPSVASAVAVLLLCILIPTMINFQESADGEIEDKGNEDQLASNASQQVDENHNQTESDYSPGNKEVIENDDTVPETDDRQTGEIYTEDDQSESNNDVTQKVEKEIEPTAVYAEDIKEQEEVLTYSIPDQNVQNFIPISVLVNKDTEQTKMDLFIHHMSQLNEEAWGLGELNPFDAAFHYDRSKQILAVDFPAETNISSSSQSEAIKEILTDMMTDFDIEQIELLTDGELGVDMGNEGYREVIEPQDTINKSAYFFYYPNEDFTKPFLVPFKEKLDSVTEAFTAMKEGIETYNLKASIPEDIDFQTEVVSDEQLLITFENDADINNDEETLYTIEAILLTAKEFEYAKVKLENADVDQIGRFDLEKEIQVPVAPNIKELP